MDKEDSDRRIQHSFKIWIGRLGELEEEEKRRRKKILYQTQIRCKTGLIEFVSSVEDYPDEYRTSVWHLVKNARDGLSKDYISSYSELLIRGHE